MVIFLKKSLNYEDDDEIPEITYQHFQIVMFKFLQKPNHPSPFKPEEVAAFKQ